MQALRAPVGDLRNSLRSERPLSVDVHGFAFTSALMRGKLHSMGSDETACLGASHSVLLHTKMAAGCACSTRVLD
jgi:hypothetical protein